MSKKFLFQAIQVSQAVLVKKKNQFSMSMQLVLFNTFLKAPVSLEP